VPLASADEASVDEALRCPRRMTPGPAHGVRVGHYEWKEPAWRRCRS
jgi:hypothetical protein